MHPPRRVDLNLATPLPPLTPLVNRRRDVRGDVTIPLLTPQAHPPCRSRVGRWATRRADYLRWSSTALFKPRPRDSAKGKKVDAPNSSPHCTGSSVERSSSSTIEVVICLAATFRVPPLFSPGVPKSSRYPLHLPARFYPRKVRAFRREIRDCARDTLRCPRAQVFYRARQSLRERTNANS